MNAPCPLAVIGAAVDREETSTGPRIQTPDTARLREARAAVAELVANYRRLLEFADGLIEEEYPETMWEQEKRELEPYRAALAKFGSAA